MRPWSMHQAALFWLTHSIGHLGPSRAETMLQAWHVHGHCLWRGRAFLPHFPNSGYGEHTREAVEDAVMAVGALRKGLPRWQEDHARHQPTGALMKDPVDPGHGGTPARLPVLTRVRYAKLPLQRVKGVRLRLLSPQHRRERLLGGS